MYSQYYAKWKKTKSISAKVKNRTKVSTLHSKSIMLIYNNNTEEGNESDKIGQEAKYSFFTSDMILSVRDPENSTRKPNSDEYLKQSGSLKQ